MKQSKILEKATESATWWVWWNKKTGGFGLGHIYGHKCHAHEDNWLSKDGHTLRPVQIKFLD